MDIDTFMDMAENPNGYDNHPEFVEMGENGEVIKYSALLPDIMDNEKVVIKSFHFDHNRGNASGYRSTGFKIPGDEFELSEFVNSTAGPIDMWDTNITSEILDEEQIMLIRSSMEASNFVERTILQGGEPNPTKPTHFPSLPHHPNRTKWLAGGAAIGVATTLTITGLVMKWMKGA